MIRSTWKSPNLVRCINSMVESLFTNKITMKLFLLLTLFSISVLGENEAFNASCTDSCVCSISDVNHVHQELLTYDCSFQGMKEFPDNLPIETEVLNLKGNSILYLKSQLSELVNLQEFDFSSNRLKSIGRENIFQNMSKLLFLNMAKNDIAIVFNEHLLGLKNLKSLVMANNRINYLEVKAFHELIHLEKLNLEQNLLGSLYEDWFIGLTQLSDMNLAHNRIHKIPATVFRRMSSLERLYLYGNRISVIDPRAFTGLTKLRVLSLENNLISIIPTPAFLSLPELEILTLDQNPIPKIKPLDFSHLSVMKVSLCQMSELTIIDSKSFYNLVNLTSLLITDNKNLRYVDPRSFMNVDKMKELQLHNNALLGIQPEIMDHIPTNLKITLFGNPLFCNCNIRWISENFHKRNISKKFTFIEPQHLVCSQPKELAQKLIKDIDTDSMDEYCAPTILNLTQSQTIKGKVGDRQILECRAIGFPRPKLHWVLPDGLLINTTLNVVRRRFFPPATLVYFHLKPSDSGKFTCIAENLRGNDSFAIDLQVTGIDVHLFPVAVSSNFVTLVWNGTERTSFPRYTIIFAIWDEFNKTTIGPKMNRSVTSITKTFTIGSLESSQTYNFCLGHENTAGYWLTLSCCIATTQSTQMFVHGIYTSHKAAFISVGAFGTFMGLVFCLLRVGSRQYKHRLYQNPDKLGGSSTSALGLTDDPSNIQMDNLHKPLLIGS